MKKLVLCLSVLIGLSLVPGPAPAADDFIGSIKKVSGEAIIIREEWKIPARVGGKLQENDILQTGPNGSLGVIFRDDTTLSLGPKSKLTVNKFVFAPAQGKMAFVTKMAKGTAAYVSGKIGKLAPKSVRFEMPLATIGIRGTRFLVKIEE